MIAPGGMDAHHLYLLCVLASLLLMAPTRCSGSPSSPPSTVSLQCSSWPADSVQNVTVDGYLRLGPKEGCSAELINVSVTFFVLPLSTIILEGWSMRHGGYVAIQGPPSAPWIIRDVAVLVTNSVIEAVNGPAVSVVLDTASAPSSFNIELRNVSLYASNSRLWSSTDGSTSTGGSPPQVAIAAVLSITFSPMASLPSRLVIVSFTTFAVDSDLRSNASSRILSTAAVASLAAAQYGTAGTARWFTVSESMFRVMRSNASAVATTGSGAAASAVAGVAFGKLLVTTVSVRGTFVSVLHSAVSTSASGSSIASEACIASSVAGLAVANTQSSPMTLASSTFFYVGWSSVVVASVASAFPAFTASNVAGMAVGFAQSSDTTVTNHTTLYVAWSDVASSSISNTLNTVTYAASSVVGMALGYAGLSLVAMENSTTAFAWQSNLSATSVGNISGFSGGLDASTGSTVAGVAVGVASTSSPVSVVNSTLFVGWCNTSSSSLSSVNSYAYAGSSVAGVALGRLVYSSAVTIANSTLTVGWSTASSSSTGLKNSPFVGSTVAGLSVAHTYSGCTLWIGSTIIYVGWSNVTSSTSTMSSLSYDAYVSSSVAGIAVYGFDVSSSNTVASSTAIYVGWSNVTSATGADARVVAASSAAGVSESSTSISVELPPIVVSSTTVTSCLTVDGVGRGAVACMTVAALETATSGVPLCCHSLTVANASFPTEVPSPGAPIVPSTPLPQVPGHGQSISATSTLSASSRRRTLTAPASSSTVTPRADLHRAPTRASSQAPQTLAWATYSVVAPVVPSRQTPTIIESRKPSPPPSPPLSSTPAPAATPRPTDSPPRGLDLDPTVATAVVVTAYGSSAVASALSPTSGNKVSATSRIVSNVDCKAVGGGGTSPSSSFPQPYEWSLLPGFVDGFSDADGDNGVGKAAAQVLTTLLAMMAVVALNPLFLH